MTRATSPGGWLLLVVGLAACAAAQPVPRVAGAGIQPPVPTASPRLSASTLAALCPRGAYSGEDADAATCWAYINGVVDVLIATPASVVPAECRQILAAEPIASVDRIRQALLDRDDHGELAVQAILGIITGRICRR